MAFCSNCGTELPKNVRFCPNCGYRTEDRRADQQSGRRFADRVRSLFASVPDHTAACSAEEIRENRVFAILAYIGILVLIPVFAAPKSRYVRVHANMGLNLLLLEVILELVFLSLRAILFPVHFWLGVTGGGYLLLITVQRLLNLLLLVFRVMGIVYAATGRARELPLINCVRLLK